MRQPILAAAAIQLVTLVAAAGCGRTVSTGTAPTASPAHGKTAAHDGAPEPTAAERAHAKVEGLAAYDRQDWATCATLLARAGDWYDAACCSARGGDDAAAFVSLDRALAQGFRDAAHAGVDPDLASLHDDPRWPTFVASVEARHAAYAATLNAELLRLYEDDQADRAVPVDQIDWAAVTPRDQARRRRVDAIIAAGQAKVADDYYHAAMVYQHGDTPDDAGRAHDLALAAVKLDPGHDTARWLAAASLDRQLMYQGKPQRYGTQYKRLDGVWTVWDVDPTVTDDERAAWNVPPLAEALARAAAMNAAP